MSWHGIEHHDTVVDLFRRGLQRHRLPSSFLFVGPAGIGKRTMAIKLAQAMLCEANAEELLEPCGQCSSCAQVAALTHPDLEVVSKPVDKAYIPVETFIGDREHRMREGLCRNISLKPMYGGRKIAIIDDADYLNVEGANCLLKTLEEPPPKSVLILIGTAVERQLPTIRSRCQTIRFERLPDQTVADLLVRHELIEDPAQAEQLALLAEGSLQSAIEMNCPEMLQFRTDLLANLARVNINSVEFAADLTKFVDSAGKEAPLRRQRMRVLFQVAIGFYRQLLRCISGVAPQGDQTLVDGATRLAHVWASDSEAVTICLERTLEAMRHVDANANQATLLESWLDDLATLHRTGRRSVAAAR